ncbi:MAG: hypothetical protein WBP77_03875, partial [Candidatus Sulfotelmatobacter sp.]
VQDRFLTQRAGSQSGDNRPVDKVFHFSDLPTVTAGFIGFAFDIREVIKVASGRGDKVYAG